jgi:hypothetical protein
VGSNPARQQAGRIGGGPSIYTFGGRSFAIWNGAGDLVFESGDAFEQRTAEALPENFNADDNENGLDAESPASGPEPEGVAVGRVAGEQ